MKMITYSLTNSYHNTECIVKIPSDWAYLSERQIFERIEEMSYRGSVLAKRKLQRIRKTLCGATDCKCGTVR